MNLMVTTNQKSITDIYTEKKNPNITLNLVIKSRQKLQRKEQKTTTKQTQTMGKVARKHMHQDSF